MRNAIRNRLLNRLTGVETRVYQPHMGGPTVQKPFVVVKMGGENKDGGMKFAYNLPVEVWLYYELTDHSDLDGLMNEVIAALHEKELETALGHRFALRYDGSSGDFEDTEWKALTRRVDFTTVRVREG